MRKSFKWIFAIFVIVSVFCGIGCKGSVDIKPIEKYGTIEGKAFYSNENVDNHSGIQITLVSTDGLMATDFCSSRGISTNARSVKDIKTTVKDGSYSFKNIPEGVYTVYASSNSSVEKAVTTNILVNANQVVTAEDLKLTATGTIKGDITIDGKTDGVLGLDVFIAGTSFDGKVGLDGSFELTSIPAKKGYVLCVQKGDYVTIIDKNLEVLGNGTVKIQTVNILSENWKQDNSIQENPTFKWLGAFVSAPKNPDLYDAYYNTEDGCSYIWNGSDWDLLAQAGKDGADGTNGKDGEDGKDGTNGKDGEDGKDGVNGTDGKDGVDGLSIVWKGALEAAPENPELYWVYYNIKDGCSYIWNGSDWDLLAQAGKDGADGTNGKDGKDGKDGVNGTDGKDGVDGLSIVWKGALEAAPENPELNWAYYNINTGCSYIWNGSSWDLLTQHANHTFNEWTVVTAPTCETEGKEERTCTVCLYKEEKSIQIIDHSYGEYVSNNDATTDKDGTKTRECSVCGYKDTVTDEGSKIYSGIKGIPAGLMQGEIYSTGITINNTIYSKTSEVVVVPKGTEAYIIMTDDSSWSTYYNGTGSKGVFLQGRNVKLCPFVMSQYEVTQELYETVMGNNPSYSSSTGVWENPEYRPVDCVSWYQILIFCNKLSLELGLTPCYTINGSENPSDWGEPPYTAIRDNIWNDVICNLDANGYRLPTEAEWEFAARGGEPTKDEWKYAYSGSQYIKEPVITSSPYVDDGLMEYGWYEGNSSQVSNEVGMKKANRLGLYDMSGNIAEWCWDWYEDNVVLNDELYTNFNGIVENPKGGSGRNYYRVIRGGFFSNSSISCFVSARSCDFPCNSNIGVGFRVVRSVR